MGFVALFFIARYMEVEQLGIVAFALSFVTMFGIIKKFGFDQAHIKRISEGKDLGECVGTFFTIKIILTTVFVVIVLGAIYIWTDILGRGFETPEHVIAIYVILGYSVIASFTEVMKMTFMAKKEIAKLQISMFLGTVMRVCATIFVALAGKGTIELAFTYIIAETTVMIVAGMFFSGFSIKRPSMKLFKSYFVFALPVVITSSIAVIITNIDKIFIQLFWGAQEVGYYFAVNRFSMFLITFSAAVALLLFPTISELHVKNDKKQIISIVNKAERYLSMFTFPIVFFMIVLPRPIIHILLADKYYPAAPVLQVLSIWALISITTRVYGPLVFGMNQPWLAAVAGSVRVSLNIVLNLLLIPVDIKILGIQGFGLGATGAAIATLAVGIFGFIYYRVVAWYIIGLKWNPKYILKHLMAASIMAFSLYYINTIFEIARWYHLISIFFIGVGIYIGILYLIHEFKKDDYNFIMDTVNPKKMISYIKGELKGNK